MQLSSLSLPALGLGLAALGRPGYINLGHGDDLADGTDVAAMERHAHAVLDAAWAQGIRYFDAARSYGRAEAFLAGWLHQRGIDPAAVAVGSKWGYTYTADWQVRLPPGQQHEVKEHSLPVLQRQVAESRELLGPHLDLYQIHSATLESGVLANEKVLAELARLREEGLAIGFSVSGPGQAETIRRGLDIERDGRPLFAAVQASWNLLEPSAGPALADARDAGLLVIVKEALANGRLTPRNQQPNFQEQMAALQEQAARLGTSLDALALAAVLNQPWAGVVLSGAARVSHLRSNVRALDVAWDGEAAARLAPLAEPREQYWQTRSRLAWN